MAHWCLVRSWTAHFWRGYWPLARKLRACVRAKVGHYEYSSWTDNVDFVHICYFKCDLFDCYIFNYEIMPAVSANTFLFILQGSSLADLRYGDKFYGTLGPRLISVCNSERIIKIGQYLSKLCSLKWNRVQFLTHSIIGKGDFRPLTAAKTTGPIIKLDI